MLWMLLACATAPEAPPPWEGPVQVVGLVEGWDGSGDVAIEACGAGTLVDADGTFLAEVGDEDGERCAVRVVWERDGARAVGPWTALPPGGPVVAVELVMPEEAAFEPLSAEARREREAIIQAAIDQLEATTEAPPQSRVGDW